MIYTIDLGNGLVPQFIQNGKKRFVCGDGCVFVNAKLKAADGTMYYAVLEIDETAQGEHHTTIILLDDEIVVQGEPNFLEKLGKTKSEFFPYKYKVSAKLKCHDIHVGPDGWST